MLSSSLLFGQKGASFKEVSVTTVDRQDYYHLQREEKILFFFSFNDRLSA